MAAAVGDRRPGSAKSAGAGAGVGAGLAVLAPLDGLAGGRGAAMSTTDAGPSVVTTRSPASLTATPVGVPLVGTILVAPDVVISSSRPWPRSTTYTSRSEE